MESRPAPTVDQAADDIRSMRVRGAAELARHAVAALGRHAREGGDTRTLRAAGEKLLRTRPTAVSLRNALEYVLGGLDTEGPAAVVARAERFIHDSLQARARVGRRAANLLADADVVLTHCNSQAAIAGILTRHADRPWREVIVLETRPWRQGILTSKQLADGGVPTRFLVDAAMEKGLDDADAVITGADTIAANGDVINKIGTALLGLASHEQRVPFYVAAESFKVDPRAATGDDVVIEEREATEVLKEPIPGVEVANPVFDVTPARRVTKIALETGPVEPQDVLDAYKRAWG